MYLHGEVHRMLGATQVREDPAEGIKWYQRAADVGFAPGQLRLGICYCLGRGVDKNPTIGRRWLVLAARQRQPDALFFLGNYYYLGWGGEENPKKARRWYSMSAKRGHREAKERLRRMDG